MWRDLRGKLASPRGTEQIGSRRALDRHNHPSLASPLHTQGSCMNLHGRRSSISRSLLLLIPSATRSLCGVDCLAKLDAIAQVLLLLLQESAPRSVASQRGILAGIMPAVLQDAYLE